MPCPDDNALVDHVHRKLAPPLAQQVARHLETCESCRQVAEALAASTTLEGDAATLPPTAGPETPALTQGQGVGRFIILQAVGRGGMGEVYAAYDPQLDRKIALKLLRVRQPGLLSEKEGNALLAREARAMAQLTHPNVVTVYEAGTVDGQVYLAMEFVQGGTLRQWQLEGARGWREVLAAYRMAGEGLAAAHAVGLVHRDFKPDNVLVSAEGTARVTDFGLARQMDGARPPSGEGGAVATPSPNADLLTLPGMVPGTPAYIAPERHGGSAADARSDQFSFCVALYEALYLVRPTAEDAARPRPPPGSGVPARVHRALVRGLSPDPAARWPSMTALLAALDRAPHPRWRRASLAAAVVALVVATVTGGRWYVERGARRCRAAGLPIAGAWDLERKDAVKRAFLGSGLPYAEHTWRAVEQVLDRYAGAWATMAVDACEATHVVGTQSEQVLDLRMLCLTRRRIHLAALTELFATPDAAVLEKAVSAATSLPAVSVCEDVAALRASLLEPEDLAMREKVARLRARLAMAEALNSSGRFRDALAVAQGVEAQAKAVGFQPVYAEALLSAGGLRVSAGENGAGAEVLTQAGLVAVASRNDEVAAQAWIRLVTVLANLNRLAEARNVEALAVAAVDRLTAGQPEGELSTRLFYAQGNHALVRGDYERGLSFLRRALALQERLFGPEHPRVAFTLTSLGFALRKLGRSEEGVAYVKRALAILKGVLGETHPSVANVHLALAQLYNATGGSGQEAELNRALAIHEAAGTMQGGDARDALSALAAVYRRGGRYDEAQVVYQRLLRVREEVRGTEHYEVGTTLLNLALNEAEWGRLDDALAHAERGWSIVSRTLDPGHPLYVRCELLYAGIRQYRGEHALAYGLLKASLARLEKPGAEPPLLALALAAFGSSALELGERKVAARHLARAVDLLRETGGGDPRDLVQVEFSLARARWELGRDPRAALDGARDAYARAQALPLPSILLKPMAQWLKQRPAL